jgi:hypothetical protein
MSAMPPIGTAVDASANRRDVPRGRNAVQQGHGYSSTSSARAMRNLLRQARIPESTARRQANKLRKNEQDDKSCAVSRPPPIYEICPECCGGNR